MSEIDDEVYPEQIGGYLRINRTGDRVILVARRKGVEPTPDGPVVQYEATTEDGGTLPATSDDFLNGRIAVGFDLVPGMAAMNFAFEKRVTD